MQKRTVQVITAAAVVFLILLVVGLLINVVQLSAQKRRLRELEVLYAEAAALSAALEDEIDLYGSEDFIERYALEYLDMHGAGAQAFKEKK